MNPKNVPPVKKPENKLKRHIDCGRILYTAFLCMCMASMLCLPAFAAGTTIWTKASEVMKDVYTQVLGISTIAAVVTAAVALLMMNFSRSGRTVDESRAWLKRIIVTWIILNSLGFIMSYVTPFFSGGQYTP
ncbi:fimbrial protein [Lawsonibacter sp. JLR.KK007]|uniref:fimbrial protein n=1 Tax=Lawsonibacter sp. JLR.KK007 TaxID=3114293 RepID=UPI003FA5851C